ncbi:bacteriohemerythrin [Telmatospirillum siberiense]|nr:hemerythrin family protein [Telmatospirillum siberiense]
MISEILEPIVWTNAHLIGNKAIDDDHRKLVLLFNELLAVCSAGADSAIIGRTLEAAITLTREHFNREEDVLQASGYPRLQAHRQEHQVLLKQLVAFGAQLTGGAPMSVDPNVVGFLREWAIRHILGHDREYAAYLQQNSLEESGI